MGIGFTGTRELHRITTDDGVEVSSKVGSSLIEVTDDTENSITLTTEQLPDLIEALVGIGLLKEVRTRYG